LRLVERHVIARADRRCADSDHAAFAAKNLYNKALYATRQEFLQDGAWPTYPALDHQTKGEPVYTALPRKVAGRRVKRGLYRAADGRHINADANGAYNVIRKVAPDAFARARTRGSRGCVVHPLRLAA
jgi:hypothetical protein